MSDWRKGNTHIGMASWCLKINEFHAADVDHIFHSNMTDFHRSSIKSELLNNLSRWWPESKTKSQILIEKQSWQHATQAHSNESCCAAVEKLDKIHRSCAVFWKKHNRLVRTLRAVPSEAPKIIIWVFPTAICLSMEVLIPSRFLTPATSL